MITPEPPHRTLCEFFLRISEIFTCGTNHHTCRFRFIYVVYYVAIYIAFYVA